MVDDQPVLVAVQFVTCGGCKFQYNDGKMIYCHRCHNDICQNCWWKHRVASFFAQVIRFSHP